MLYGLLGWCFRRHGLVLRFADRFLYWLFLLERIPPSSSALAVIITHPHGFIFSLPDIILRDSSLQEATTHHERTSRHSSTGSRSGRGFRLRVVTPATNDDHDDWKSINNNHSDETSQEGCGGLGGASGCDKGNCHQGQKNL